MTPKEAIDFYNQFLIIRPANPYQDAAKLSIQALEKQIAKKPTDNKCPCGSYVKARKRFCGTCGQALDWSETE